LGGNRRLLVNVLPDYCEFLYLLPPGLPSRTIAWTVSAELLGFSFYFSLFFRLWAVRWIKLAISSAFQRMLIYLSYRKKKIQCMAKERSEKR